MIRVAAVVLPALAAGCSGPISPYGQPADPISERAPAQELARPLRAPSRAPTLILGALDDLTTQPLGGAYPDQEGEPLLSETYFYWALESKLRAELRDELSRRGLTVLVDPLDTGVASRRSAPWPSGIVFLRGEIETFSFSRSPRGDQLRLRLTLRLVAPQGTTSWSGAVRIEQRVPEGHDLFRFATRLVGDSLLADPKLRSALGGS